MYSLYQSLYLLFIIKNKNVKPEDYKGIHRNSFFFCLVTLHLWGRIFKRFPDLRDLAYADHGNMIGRLSQALRIVSELKSGFKLDVNLDFNLGKTMFLTKGTTDRHVYEWVQFFL